MITIPLDMAVEINLPNHPGDDCDPFTKPLSYAHLNRLTYGIYQDGDPIPEWPQRIPVPPPATAPSADADTMGQPTREAPQDSGRRFTAQPPLFALPEE